MTESNKKEISNYGKNQTGNKVGFYEICARKITSSETRERHYGYFITMMLRRRRTIYFHLLTY